MGTDWELGAWGSPRWKMDSLKIEPYSSAKKDLWDAHVTAGKNSHFQFYRDYMEYHRERFTDASLLFYHGPEEELVGILPANLYRGTLYSHQGLSFGGLVVRQGIKPPTVLRLFEGLVDHALKLGASRLVYKALPRFYHAQPAEEDLYALFRLGAKLYRRDITSLVPLGGGVRFDYNRERSIKKGRDQGVEVRQSDDLPAYFEILTKVLEDRHGVRPVHSLEEMQRLAKAFPQNIRLYGAFRSGRMVAGSVVYEQRHIAHAQYIANSEEGRKLCALDVLFAELIGLYSGKMRYFDFGTSNENDGLVLNEGLVNHKTGFGAGGAVHDYYEVDLERLKPSGQV